MPASMRVDSRWYSTRIEAGLDSGGVPAGIVLARGDLELALGEADRAALVVARPAARGALPGIARVERAQRLPVAARRPARRQHVPLDPAHPGPQRAQVRRRRA